MLVFAYKNKKLVKIQKSEGNLVIAYSIVGESEENWYFPLIVDGENVEKFEFVKE